MTARPEAFDDTSLNQLDSGRTGVIISINISNGGVPKKAIDDAQVSRLGLVGDAHNDVFGHGGPDRAVCVYPIELIRSLRKEGHAIDVGTSGENLTVEGIDWDLVVPGARIRCGDGVELEVASYTNPCKTNKDSFAEGEFKRISQKVNPGWSRVYARVVSEGKIRRGDPIRVIAPGV
jgi:MOSC domain-containing protein YiiM